MTIAAVRLVAAEGIQKLYLASIQKLLQFATA